MVRLHGEDQHGLQRQTGKFSLNFSRGKNCDVIPIKTIVNRKTDFRETFFSGGNHGNRNHLSIRMLGRLSCETGNTLLKILNIS